MTTFEQMKNIRQVKKRQVYDDGTGCFVVHTVGPHGLYTLTDMNGTEIPLDLRTPEGKLNSKRLVYKKEIGRAAR